LITRPRNPLIWMFKAMSQTFKVVLGTKEGKNGSFVPFAPVVRCPREKPLFFKGLKIDGMTNPTCVISYQPMPEALEIAPKSTDVIRHPVDFGLSLNKPSYLRTLGMSGLRGRIGTKAVPNLKERR
jgi:hypothetical protein